MSKFPQYSIEKLSSICFRNYITHIPVVKKCNYEIVEGFTIAGDAPKKFIRLYDNEDNHTFFKKNKKRWPLYIAKTGHKWYPIESITEYLLNQLGEAFGLRMAKSSLRIVGNQVRFLSRYFLKGRTDELIHGAEIFAGYIGDREFIEAIETEALARDFFTLQFVEKSVVTLFPYQKDEIMHDFVKMLLFDALVGNNDRHFYNWGIIRSITNSYQPYFSPIYDTARGLFWNDDDDKLANRFQNNRDSYIQKYCKNSKPKIGWEGESNINHFKLVSHIFNNEFYISKSDIRELFNASLLEQMYSIIDNRFCVLMSPQRVEMIKLCLQYRYNQIIKLLV